MSRSRNCHWLPAVNGCHSITIFLSAVDDEASLAGSSGPNCSQKWANFQPVDTPLEVITQLYINHTYNEKINRANCCPFFDRYGSFFLVIRTLLNYVPKTHIENYFFFFKFITRPFCFFRFCHLIMFAKRPGWSCIHSCRHRWQRTRLWLLEQLGSTFQQVSRHVRPWRIWRWRRPLSLMLEPCHRIHLIDRENFSVTTWSTVDIFLSQEDWSGGREPSLCLRTKVDVEIKDHSTGFIILVALTN